jgi:hypothetical protein
MNNMSDSRRRLWNEEATNALIEMWPRVSSIVLIALELNRTTSSVQTQASRRGLPRRNEANERHRRKWTPEDLRLLEVTLDKHTNRNGDIYICEIAEDMKRSIDAVSAKLVEILGPEEEIFPKYKVTAETGTVVAKLNPLKPAKRKNEPGTRDCMTCRRPFWSEGWGNRICQPCKKEEAGADGYDW